LVFKKIFRKSNKFLLENGGGDALLLMKEDTTDIEVCSGNSHEVELDDGTSAGDSDLLPGQNRGTDKDSRSVDKRTERDKKWVLQALAGDQKSFIDLVDAYTSLWYLIVYGITHNQSEAEEIVQEGVVKIYEALPSLNKPESFSSWTYTLFKRLAITHIQRQRAVKKLESVWTETEQILASTEDFSLDTKKLLMDLPDIYRDPSILYYVHGYSIQDVSQILDESRATIEMRLYRARKLMRRMMEKKQK